MQHSLEEEMQAWEEGTALLHSNPDWALTHSMTFANLLHLCEMAIITFNHHTWRGVERNDGEL